MLLLALLFLLFPTGRPLSGGWRLLVPVSISFMVVFIALATLAHGTGGLLWRIRCLVTRKTNNDAPHFLRSLLLHDLKALISGLFRGSGGKKRMFGRGNEAKQNANKSGV